MYTAYDGKIPDLTCFCCRIFYISNILARSHFSSYIFLYWNLLAIQPPLLQAKPNISYWYRKIICWLLNKTHLAIKCFYYYVTNKTKNIIIKFESTTRGKSIYKSIYKVMYTKKYLTSQNESQLTFSKAFYKRQFNIYTNVTRTEQGSHVLRPPDPDVNFSAWRLEFSLLFRLRYFLAAIFRCIKSLGL